MTLTGLIAKENVVSTFATLYSLGDLGEGDAAMWAAFAQMVPTAGAMMAFAAFNLLCAPCFAAIGTIRKQMNSPKWFWFAIGYECVFAWVVALLINQFYRWFALGLFGPWTVVASDPARAHALPALPPGSQALAGRFRKRAAPGRPGPCRQVAPAGLRCAGGGLPLVPSGDNLPVPLPPGSPAREFCPRSPFRRSP